jgi:hypothetical protein
VAEAADHPRAKQARRVTIVRRADCAHGKQAVLAVERLARNSALPIDVRDVVVRTDDDAVRERCLGSPTVLVAGRDVDPSARGRTSYGVT